jgi:ribosomal protein S12 methylthiotransferase accessory factor
MTTWLHGLPGQQRPLGERRLAPVLERGGQVVCVDATPAYSAFPVAVVAGALPVRGRPRIALGAACRARWEDAVEKAYLEWAQGTVYAGHIVRERPTLRFANYADVTSFEDHAAYYTVQPEQWPAVPLPHGAPAPGAPVEAQGATPAAQLAEALARLREHGVRVYYRDLTTIELRQLGLTCVRVLSPDLTPIHCDQRWPFLGGRAADALWRYPWARDCPRMFPNPLPHPLG